MLSALVHPVFIAVAGYLAATNQLFDTSGSAFGAALLWLYLGALVSGYLTSAALGLMGLKRRGLLRQGWVLLLMPLHWLLLSVAAWRALYQLLFNPFHWEKTTHGLARTSRLGKRSGFTLITAKRSEIAAQLRRPVFGLPLQAERRDELAVLVHQVHDGGVVHRVVAVLGRHLLVVDAIGLRDRRKLLRIATDADEPRIEASQIVFQYRRSIALRIER